MQGSGFLLHQRKTRLLADVAEREAVVRAAVKVPLTQHQFDALVSIVFNVGAGSALKDGIVRLRNGEPSTLLRLLNAGDPPDKLLLAKNTVVTYAVGGGTPPYFAASGVPASSQRKSAERPWSSPRWSPGAPTRTHS